MATIPDYLESRLCPACGMGGASAKYEEKRQILNLVQRKFSSLGLMKRMCQHCSFVWYEIPLHLIDQG